MTPELKAYTFSLVPGETAKRFPVRGNFVFIDTADARFELSLDNSNFVPEKEGRMIHLDDEFADLYLRANSTTPCSGIFIVGRGGGISHAGYGGAGGGDFDILTNPMKFKPYESYAELAAVISAPLNTGTAALVITGTPPSAETWQLRTWTPAAAPVTDPANGIITPADYSTTNKRAWFRA